MQLVGTDYEHPFQCSLQFNNVKAGTYAISSFARISLPFMLIQATHMFIYLTEERHHVRYSN